MIQSILQMKKAEGADYLWSDAEVQILCSISDDGSIYKMDDAAIDFQNYKSKIDLID